MDYRKIEKLEPCPYNSSHQILPHRMAKHIIKCKKNYPDADMKVCIFNAVHVVPTHQYQAHLLECEDRQLVERELFSRPPVMQEGILTKTEATPVVAPTKYDDWESDCVQASYSPGEHIIYKEFTRAPPPGLSKGARKQWRLNEIERVNRLKSGMLVGDPWSDTVSQRSGVLVNSGSGASGAVPKLQDKKVKSDTSSSESDMENDQVSRKSRQPYVAAAISSPDQPAQNCSLGNHINKSQILQQPKGRLDMTTFIKEKRKLEKKLFEIRRLKDMKINFNQKLTDQEESKILLKASILEQLSQLINM